MLNNRLFSALAVPLLWVPLMAQVPDAPAGEDDDEDYSLYDEVEFADAGTKRFCSPKVFDLSPQRFISIGWDFQAPFDINASALGAFTDGSEAPAAETGRVSLAQGFRIGANVPIVSRNNILWQMGANIWDVRYGIRDIQTEPGAAGLLQQINERGLRTVGINTTLFKPLDDRHYLLFQGAADLNGDYSFTQFQSLRYLRYSWAAVYGQRPSDRKMWGFGLARTYRVGEMNYIPVVLYNYTAANRKWGAEILFPARAHYRRTFNTRSILLAGYELEGQSYRIGALSDAARSLEIRRGELRARVDYQRQLVGFIWISAQLGWRYNWSFNADYLTDNGQEFFRGFFGDQTYAMLNQIGNPLYFNISLHLVSP